MAGSNDDEATSLDLTALMDILSNLIFFLMASFGAAIVAMIPASVPTISESGDNDTAREEDKVTAKMQLLADGAVTISVSNNELRPDELSPYTKSFIGKCVEPPGDKPCPRLTIDAKAVNDHLWSIKSKFKKSSDIIIVPDNDVTYALLIEAMDASRSRTVIVDDTPTYPRLFPKVVVSSLAQ